MRAKEGLVGFAVVAQCGTSGYEVYNSALTVGAGSGLGTGDAQALPGGCLRLAADPSV
jgi:hypothetical protein